MNYRFHFVYDCKKVADGIQFSDLPQLSPLYTGVTDILCLMILCWFRLYKKKWQNITPANRNRTILLVVLSIISTISTIWSIVVDSYPWISQTLKPIIVLVFSSSTR